jgi:hypothetical protein
MRYYCGLVWIELVCAANGAQEELAQVVTE